jgi:predicted nucleic acid-binding protein
MIVIADTTPLNYLVLIDAAHLLPRLFGQVFIPPAVWDELNDPDTPARVRTWLSQPPTWLRVQPLLSAPDPSLEDLDDGERQAIALAIELHADQILVDELSARQEAARRQLPFIGTLGILRRAAQLGWIDLPAALSRLQQTTFFVSPDLIRRCWTKINKGRSDEYRHGFDLG